MPGLQPGDRRFKSGRDHVTETERKIKEIFKSKMEELAFQSTGGGTDSHGNPMTVESFWADAGNIFNEALDSLIALKEYS